VLEPLKYSVVRTLNVDLNQVVVRICNDNAHPLPVTRELNSLVNDKVLLDAIFSHAFHKRVSLILLLKAFHLLVVSTVLALNCFVAERDGGLIAVVLSRNARLRINADAHLVVRHI
jgi:hypothetical protein